MKVKYGDNIYTFKGDLNCLLFSSLIEEGIEEVELSMFENIFKKILNDTLIFNKENNYITLYQGLSYFGSSKEKELVKYLFNMIYNKEKKELQKEIVEFFEENVSFINWNAISQNPSIPVEFFEKYIDRINWINIGANKGVPIYFFKKYLNKIYWYYLCQNPSIPLEFFKEHKNKIDWQGICYNTSIPLEFFKENNQHIDLMQLLLHNHSIPFDYLEIIKLSRIELIDFSHPQIPLSYIEKFARSYHWNEICSNKGLSLDFFEKNINNIHWTILSQNPVINIDFVNKYSYLINWYTLSANPSISLSFLENNLDKIHWGYICANPNITFDFIKKHMHQHQKPKRDFFESTNYMNWYNICKNDFNLEKRILEKIENTTYFDFEPLEKSIKNYFN